MLDKIVQAGNLYPFPSLAPKPSILWYAKCTRRWLMGRLVLKKHRLKRQGGWAQGFGVGWAMVRQVLRQSRTKKQKKQQLSKKTCFFIKCIHAIWRDHRAIWRDLLRFVGITKNRNKSIWPIPESLSHFHHCSQFCHRYSAFPSCNLRFSRSSSCQLTSFSLSLA